MSIRIDPSIEPVLAYSLGSSITMVCLHLKFSVASNCPLTGGSKKSDHITSFVSNSKFCNLRGPGFEPPLHLAFIDTKMVAKLMYIGFFYPNIG